MADINQVQLPDGSQYNIKDTMSGYATTTYVQDQISAITKATIGLGNVDNTSDMNKPVSTAQQTAIDAKANNSAIAYTESSATATKRYEIGDQFILNGVLYTATAIIANGGTITVGTNCTASDTIIEQIPNIDGKADKTDLASISITGTTNNTGSIITRGTILYLNGSLVRIIANVEAGATFTLNTNYVPLTDGGLNELNNISLLAPEERGNSNIKNYADSFYAQAVKFYTYTSASPDAPSAYDGYVMLVSMGGNFKHIVAFSRDGNIYVTTKVSGTWGTWKKVTVS